LLLGGCFRAASGLLFLAGVGTKRAVKRLDALADLVGCGNAPFELEWR
jgi:hypothetical protein